MSGSLRSVRRIGPLAAIAIFAGAGQGQQPPARDLGPAVATSSEPFQSAVSAVQLSDGRVVVNDPRRRRLVLLDSELRFAAVLLDSALGRRNSYGGGSLAPFRGDSVLWADRTSGGILVIAASGVVQRSIAPPPLGPAMPGTINTMAATVAFSSAHGLIYRDETFGPLSRGLAPFRRPAAGQPPVSIVVDDSVPVISMALDSRQPDTLSLIATGSRSTITLDARGAGESSALNSFPYVDGYAVTTDGSVALLRSRDYRIEWINADRTRTISPRMPYPWRAITDEMKTRIRDSINAEWRARYDTNLTRWISDSAAGRPQTSTMTSTIDGRRTTRQVENPRPQPPPAYAEELPDFFPPTARDPIRADADNNVWILPRPNPSPPVGTPAVYDIVNRRGQLVDRVRIPFGTTIAGFAPGHVFLVTRDGDRAILTRVRIRG